MTSRIIHHDGTAWRFTPEDPVPDADRFRSLLRGRVVDEIDGSVPRGDIHLQTPLSGVTTRVGADGLFGLVGNPARRFPGLDVSATTLELRVEVGGYLGVTLRRTLGPIPGFPNGFIPVDVGSVPLHRPGTRVRGRAVRLVGADHVALDFAVIEVMDFHPTFPAAGAVVPPSPPDFVALTPGAYADRPLGATARRRQILLDLPNTKVLEAPAVPGADRIRISDRVALAVGTPLVFDAGHPDLEEIVVVTAVDGATTPDQPATITLAHGLSQPHDERTPVVPATLQPPGPANPLTREAIPGDRCLFLGGLGGLGAPTSVIEISGGTAAAEYQRISRFRVDADADGYFRLPPVSRVARMQLRVTHPALGAPVTRDVSPDYTQPEHRFDVVAT